MILNFFFHLLQEQEEAAYEKKRKQQEVVSSHFLGISTTVQRSLTAVIHDVCPNISYVFVNAERVPATDTKGEGIGRTRR